MTVGAKVLFGGTTVQLPARSDYEREILFDYVQDATHRHGRVQLRAGRYTCTLRPARRAAGVNCNDCHHQVRVVVCELGKARLCLPCLWRRVAAKSASSSGLRLASTAAS